VQKKILINLSPSIWPMLEYELDIIQRKLDDGFKVKILVCKSNTNFCSANNFYFLKNKKISLVCNICKSRFSNGIKWLKNTENLTIDEFDSLNTNQRLQINKISNILEKNNYFSALKKISKVTSHYKVNISEIVKTSFVTETTSTQLNYDKNYELYKKLLLKTCSSYFSSLNHIMHWKPDEIYTFNGRETKYGAFLRTGQLLINKNNIYVYEYPFNGHKNYLLVKKNYPHDQKNMAYHLHNKYKIIKKNNTINKLYEKKIANKIINQREKYLYNQFIPWTKRPKKKFENSFPNKFIISFLLSSDFEFVGIKEIERLIPYNNQIDAINKITKYFLNYNHVQFIIKMHPWSGSEAEREYNKNKLLDLVSCNKNITLFDYNSEVSTYSLIKESNLVMTFTSFTGLEASYFQIPVLNIGTNFYEKFKCSLNLYNHNQILAVIKRALKNDFSAFPSKINRHANACKAIFAYCNIDETSKYVDKKKINDKRMIRDNIIYKIESNILLNFLFFPIRILRKIFFILKKKL
jgi:hypothetical protein